MFSLPDIRKADVSGKRVFLRADTDVPVSNGVIEDDTRLAAWFPTLEYLLGQGAHVVIGGKLGRPEGVDLKFSLKPIGNWLAEHLNDLNHLSKINLGGLSGWKINDNLFLLENLQFYPEEKANDPDFTDRLAALADVYVNDAFAVCHRNHASVVGVAGLLPHFAGLRLQEEINVLGSVLDDPKRPLVVIVGGIKIETKQPLVVKMLTLADHVLVGGKIATEVHVSDPKLTVARLNTEGTDITPESVEEFTNIIQTAKTVVWNGPVGKISNSESEDTERGTREVAKAIVESHAYKVVGGGDTIEFLRKNGLLNQFDFISMGGGAMLAFLSGEKLPGLEALSSS